MAKSRVVVLSAGDQVDADKTLAKVLEGFSATLAELKEVGGSRTVIEQKKSYEVAANALLVDPEKKYELLQVTHYLRSLFQADKGRSNTGAAVKADMVKLGNIYVEFMRNKPNKSRAVALMEVAMRYNNEVGEGHEIDGTYVGRVAKANEWDNRINVPEPATA